MCIRDSAPSAKISVNKESASGMTYSDETGVLIWAGAMRGETINGDKTLFLLDVTPGTKSPVTISVLVTQTFTGTKPAVQVKNYAGYEAVLKIGENIGGGKEILPDDSEIENNGDTQRYDDKEGIDVPLDLPDEPEIENNGDTQKPVEIEYFDTQEDLPDIDDSIQFPYWILIIIASTALVILIIITKKR